MQIGDHVFYRLIQGLNVKYVPVRITNITDKRISVKDLPGTPWPCAFRTVKHDKIFERIPNEQEERALKEIDRERNGFSRTACQEDGTPY